MKYVLAIFFILSLATAVFGFVGMNHSMTDGKMADGGCVASILDSSVCATDALSMAIHHISSYQSFSNILAPSYLAFVLFSSLLVLSFSYLFWRYFLFAQSAIYLRAHLRNSPDLLFSRSQKITHWLSLLENSPSFSYKT